MKIFGLNIYLCCIPLILFSLSFSQDPDFHIYLCFGQSNMAGAGTIEDKDKTVDSRFQMMEPIGCQNLNRTFGEWYPAVPPLWGCNGGLGPTDYFGRTMVENLPSNIKVGVIVVAIPGCDIALFFKNGYEGYDTYNYVPKKYGGSAYAWLLDLAKKAQQDGVIKGILLHQGESNNTQRDWPDKVMGVYDNLISDLDLVNSQTPLLVGELLYQNAGGACYGHNSVIATVPDVIPNSYVISAEGLSGKDQFHFNSEGNRTFGIRYAQKMLSLLEADDNIPPVVDITVPSNNSSFSTIETVTVNATASDADGEVVFVSFMDGTDLIGTDSTIPYSVEWSGMKAGTHNITARATDDKGLSTLSTAVTVLFRAVQAPFNGAAHQVPGRIEAEEYDLGGEGVAYHEENANGNEGNVSIRNDQVDIEETEDNSGQYNIGYVLQGEWLKYTVNVTRAGIYSIDLRIAAEGDGKNLHIEIDGVNVSGNVKVPDTGGWQTWTNLTINDVELLAGEHIVSVVFDASYINLNYLEFKETVSTVKNSKAFNEGQSVKPSITNEFEIRLNGDYEYIIAAVNGTILERGRSRGVRKVGAGLSMGVYLLSIRNYEGKFTRKVLKR